MLTIVPPPDSRIDGKAALDSKNGALRFTESVRSQPSTSNSSTVPGVSVPAALTSTSMRPKASTARSTAPAASSSLARSMGKVNARRPVCETSSLVLSSSSSLLATSATSAPARARAIVVARPSPLLAPVTSATLPSRGRSPFTASLMLCHPPSDAMGTMGKKACHVCEPAASSEALAFVDALFCQRYCSYTLQTLRRGLLRWPFSVLCRIYSILIWAVVDLCPNRVSHSERTESRSVDDIRRRPDRSTGGVAGDHFPRLLGLLASVQCDHPLQGVGFYYW